MAKATVGCGGGQPSYIQKGPAAHRHQIGVAVEVMAVDLRVDFGNVEIGIFEAFPSLEHDGKGHQLEAVGHFSEAAIHHTGKLRLRRLQAFIQNDQNFRFSSCGFRHEHLPQHRVGGMEEVLREIDGVLESELDFPVNRRRNACECLPTGGSISFLSLWQI